MLDYTKGATPLYNQIKEIIKNKIITGIYPVNESIPTEKELQKDFNASRITVRRALNELANDGYIKSQRGKGTIVLKRNIVEEENHIDRSFTEHMKSKGITVGTKFSRLNTVMAVGKIAEALELELGHKVLELTRVRTTDETPIVIFKTYLNPDIVEITSEEVEANESLYYLLKQKGQFIKLKHEIFEVTLSMEWISGLLEVPLGTPILKRSSIGCSGDTPMIYTESFYNGYIYHHSISHS